MYEVFDNTINTHNGKRMEAETGRRKKDFVLVLQSLDSTWWVSRRKLRELNQCDRVNDCFSLPKRCLRSSWASGTTGDTRTSCHTHLDTLQGFTPLHGRDVSSPDTSTLPHAHEPKKWLAADDQTTQELFNPSRAGWLTIIGQPEMTAFACDCEIPTNSPGVGKTKVFRSDHPVFKNWTKTTWIFETSDWPFSC